MININNIAFSYNDKTIFKDFSLNINDGEFVSIIGKNGSGKSTLTKLLNGLLIPQNGDVIINGIKTSNTKQIFELRKNISIVFQNPDNQIVAAVVEDEVAFGAENIGMSPDEIELNVAKLLKKIGLNDKATYSTAHLSGGEKQRLAIASALITKPKIIVFDEATSMLDPMGKSAVLNIAKELNNNGMTVIMVTHNMEEAILTDRCIVLDYGNIVLDDTPQNIFKNPDKLEELSLTIPDIIKLKISLQNKGINISDNIKTVDDMCKALCDLKRKD